MELGSGEIMLILLVALLIYGGRLPDVARAIGRSIGDLKRGLTETREAVTKGLAEDETPPRPDAPREVLRTPAPRDLATEDITKPDEPPAPKHENPN
jgi:sec-independent protein translocase protein TatA